MDVLHKLGFVGFWNDIIVSAITSVNLKYHSILNLVIVIWVSGIFLAGMENKVTISYSRKQFQSFVYRIFVSNVFI